MKSRYVMHSPAPSVAIIQKSLHHYRLPFYRQLKDELDDVGIHLQLIYGQAPDEEPLLSGQQVQLDWARPIKNTTFRLGQHTLCWQPCLHLLREADLVIVEQASRLLLNYPLFLRQVTGRQKLAFWGHGKNLQVHRASPLGEALKKYLSRRVHWWFAYNMLSRRIVRTLGFPDERITDVQNAINTRQLTDAYRTLSPDAVLALRDRLGLQGENVCLYVGSMYPEKRLDFLLQTCQLIRARIPDFEMIFIGTGSEASAVTAASQHHDWLHYMGAQYGEDRVPYFKLAKLLLLPGAVGLAILDAFALETPIVTTNDPAHGPEIAYLKSGINGLIAAETHNPGTYAQATAELLCDESRRQRMIARGQADSMTYTIEEMARRFGAGIRQALAAQ